MKAKSHLGLEKLSCASCLNSLKKKMREEKRAVQEICHAVWISQSNNNITRAEGKRRGIRGKKTRRWGKKENLYKISEPTAHNRSPDSAQLRLECVIRDRPDVTGTEHRFGSAKKGEKGYKGHSGQRWKMSTPEAEGFLQVVLTLNWAKSQWRREWRVSFDISVAYGGGVSSQMLSGQRGEWVSTARSGLQNHYRNQGGSDQGFLGPRSQSRKAESTDW